MDIDSVGLEQGKCTSTCRPRDAGRKNYKL